MMKGYLDNLQATQDTMNDGWLHTGDIVYYDKNEHFFVVDRIKELIKVKGAYYLNLDWAIKRSGTILFI